MNHPTITIVLDDLLNEDEIFSIFGQLHHRWGHAALTIDLEFVPVTTSEDDLTDDESAADINELTIMANLRAELAPVSVDRRISLWREAQRNFTGHNAMMRAIDAEVADLVAEQFAQSQRVTLDDVTDTDPTPPHGLPRPKTRRDKRDREAARKRKEREVMVELSPRVIAMVSCPTCQARMGEPCKGPSGYSFGFTGHTHLARREAYTAAGGES